MKDLKLFPSNFWILVFIRKVKHFFSLLWVHWGWQQLQIQCSSSCKLFHFCLEKYILVHRYVHYLNCINCILGTGLNIYMFPLFLSLICDIFNVNIRIHLFSLECGERQTECCQNDHEAEWGHSKLVQYSQLQTEPTLKICNWHRFSFLLQDISWSWQIQHPLICISSDFSFWPTLILHRVQIWPQILTCWASSKKYWCCIWQKFWLERNFWISMKSQHWQGCCNRRWKIFAHSFERYLHAVLKDICTAQSPCQHFCKESFLTSCQ